jgi:DNA-binding NtrC family response regulator
MAGKARRGGGERTLTAMLTPLANAGGPDAPVLFVAGRADRALATSDRRVLGRAAAFDIGRGGGDGGEDDGSGTGGRLALDDRLVSGQHARIVREGDAHVLIDLDSKNGTFVDGQRLSPRSAVPLREGAIVFIGNHVLVFRMVSALDLDAVHEDLARPLGPVATTSPRLARACSALRRLAPTDGELLLLGETGVGKEVYARAVHAASGRSGRFVAINCAALPDDLVESELFGYRRGAHSTARAAKPGLIEEAEGGTLFLDEVGDMPSEGQSKMLRFLQDKLVTPLGATRPRALDVRVLAATNRPVTGGGVGVRQDLLGRLGASAITLPLLRERIEDMGALIAHFTPDLAFELPAFRALFLHEWPLNVRNLEKVLATARALSEGRRPVALRDLPDAVALPPPARVAAPAPAQVTGRSEAEPLPATRPGAVQPAVSSTVGPSARAVPDVARDMAPPDQPRRKAAAPAPTAEQIKSLLAEHAGNVADVSRALGRQRAAVWRWIKQFGLSPSNYRRNDQATPVDPADPVDPG